MARRTHEELINALDVLDFRIEEPPSEATLNKRWKELLTKVHSDTPGGSEFLSKQLNVSRDVIKEWLAAGRPQWPSGKRAEAEKTAAQRAKEKADRERAEERAQSEKARADRAEEELRKAREREANHQKDYAEKNWDKHFRPDGDDENADDFEGAKDFFKDQAQDHRLEKERLYQELDRRLRRRGLIKFCFKWGSAAVVAGGLYIGVNSGWGRHWPYIAEQPTFVILCYSKNMPKEFNNYAFGKANAIFDGFWFKHANWWRGHQMIFIEYHLQNKNIVSVRHNVFDSEEELLSSRDCFNPWQMTKFYGPVKGKYEYLSTSTSSK